MSGWNYLDILSSILFIFAVLSFEVDELKQSAANLIFILFSSSFSLEHVEDETRYDVLIANVSSDMKDLQGFAIQQKSWTSHCFIPSRFT